MASANVGDRLFIVRGAPGAGKSATLDAFLALRTPYVAFDIDWLAGTASDLAGASIIHDPATWRPYRAMWFEILHGVARNGRVPVLFASIDKDDVADVGQPAWCDGIEWLLLDCTDAVRRERLARRQGWTGAMIVAALADAAALRASIDSTVDTSAHPPHDVAMHILAWLDQQ